MKTSKEFFERLAGEPEFINEINGAVFEAVGDKCQDKDKIMDAISAAAAARDYEVTAEELEQFGEQTKTHLSDEELGKVSGGCTPFLLISLTLATAGSVFITLQGAGDD